jgi:hypothetical protein
MRAMWSGRAAEFDHTRVHDFLCLRTDKLHLNEAARAADASRVWRAAARI